MSALKKLQLFIMCLLLTLAPHFLWRREWTLLGGIFATILFGLLLICGYRWQPDQRIVDPKSWSVVAVAVTCYLAFTLFVWFAAPKAG